MTKHCPGCSHPTICRTHGCGAEEARRNKATLKAPSDAARSIAKALNLPKNTVAFTLSMRVGEAAKLVVETQPGQEEGKQLAAILQHYRIQEIEGPNAELSPPSPMGEVGLNERLGRSLLHNLRTLGTEHSDFSVGDEAADEIVRLSCAVELLMVGLKQVSTRPAEESAFIAEVFLKNAKDRYGVRIV